MPNLSRTARLAADLLRELKVYEQRGKQLSRTEERDLRALLLVLNLFTENQRLRNQSGAPNQA